MKPKTIPNINQRAGKAMIDPIATLAIELSNEGYTETDVAQNTKHLPDVFRTKLLNYMRDIRISGKPIEGFRL
jgi:hypothetical protein